MATIIDTPEGIRYAQMAAAYHAIKLEKLGMRHSKLGSVKALWARHLGMSPRVKHDMVLAELKAMMDRALMDRAKGVQP
jgi:hypothetical protein